MGQYAVLKNQYVTEKTIGTGGFAKVKLARHLLTGEKVAIKIMDKDKLGDDLPRVKMELDALKSLVHQHICRLYQVIETETHFFLIMEYCAGGELFDHIVQCTRLSEMNSRSFFRQILSAVAFLHSKGYVHRDIKPENILLDKDQCVKMIDFGLCARPSPSQDFHLDTACGSPTYAAPELIKGEKYLGTGVDVWSMGVMLYALLCGCLPFDSDKIDTLYKQILSGEYNKPNHLSKGSKLILKEMLETDPAERITVNELLSHPWVQLGYNEPVSFNTLYKALELDNNCINTMASFFEMSGVEMWRQIQENPYDYHSATYQLLLSRKKQHLPLQLGVYEPRSARNRLQSMRRTVVGAVSTDAKGTYVVLPEKKSKTNTGTDQEKENFGEMQPPEGTPARMLRKRQRSISRDPSASPVTKRVASTPKRKETTLSTPKRNNTTATPKQNGPSTPKQNNNGKDLDNGTYSPSVFVTPTRPVPTERISSPSSRLFSSIERKLQHVRKVLTPKRSGSSAQPTLLTAKKMSNISTTSSNNPDDVKNALIEALKRRNIECICKGYSVRGKLNPIGGKDCKLSFELEVCLIPTTTNSVGSIVGIRRKRLKGDAWSYKKICEEVLKMANL